MNKKFFPLIFFLLIPIYGCGNSNTKTGTTDIQISQEGMIDQSTRDIISKEYDAKGNLLNCTIGNSSWKRGLPSCNEIIDKRTKDFEKIALAEQKRLEKEKREKIEQFKKSLKEEKQKLEIERREEIKINELITRKKTNTKSFAFPNGLKIKTISQIRLDPQLNKIIVNCEILKQVGDLDQFTKIFIEGNSRIEIAFFDKQKLELANPIIFPLNIYEGQKAGFKYKKNVGKNISDLKGIKIIGEESNISTSEFMKIDSIDVSIKI